MNRAFSGLVKPSVGRATWGFLNQKMVALVTFSLFWVFLFCEFQRCHLDLWFGARFGGFRRAKKA